MGQASDLITPLMVLGVVLLVLWWILRTAYSRWVHDQEDQWNAINELRKESAKIPYVDKLEAAVYRHMEQSQAANDKQIEAFRKDMDGIYNRFIKSVDDLKRDVAIQLDKQQATLIEFLRSLQK